MRQVTWYSKCLAIILFVFVFLLGFDLGSQAGRMVIDEKTQADQVHSSNMDIKSYVMHDARELLDMRQGAGLENLAFRVASEISSYLKYYPDDQEVIDISAEIFESYGPCWGIPNGMCSE
jgi:hypothetical protein